MGVLDGILSAAGAPGFLDDLVAHEAVQTLPRSCDAEERGEHAKTSSTWSSGCLRAISTSQHRRVHTMPDHQMSRLHPEVAQLEP